MKADNEGASLDPKFEEIISDLRAIHAGRPTKTLAINKTAKTAETIQRILSASYDVFVSEGHANLSLRKVADEAGIAVGNLTYHFATKKDLIQATLEERLAGFVEAHLAEFEAGGETPQDILLNVVAFYARDARQSHRFFYQMWGYAGSGEDARILVRDLYRPIGRFILRLVRAANPDLDSVTARRIVLQIFSLEEGYKLFVGLGPDDDIALQTVESDIRALTKQMISSDRN